MQIGLDGLSEDEVGGKIEGGRKETGWVEDWVYDELLELKNTSPCISQKRSKGHVRQGLCIHSCIRYDE